ncbi:SAM-dependent methyltransferase [Streptomyces sp. NPDC051366]|uniref:SAM-dependent methyltransferase n=1 Tax=Streptomyces sp. NPDC051366 TaxID=3365652 RepID=UPI0037877167
MTCPDRYGAADSVYALLDRASRPATHDSSTSDARQAPGRRAQTTRCDLHAAGIDNDAETIDAAQRAIADAGLRYRIVFHAQDAKEFTFPHLYDLVLSIGATHAFGGLLPTLSNHALVQDAHRAGDDEE